MFGQGDSAIHLLADITDVSRGQPPLILRACLIDGGKGDGYKKIKDCISAVLTDYRLPAGVPNLQFDSVVITHWDTDHYKGVLDLINDNLREQIGKAYTGDNPVYAGRTGSDEVQLLQARWHRTLQPADHVLRPDPFTVASNC
jgi:hypothetical protein